MSIIAVDFDGTVVEHRFPDIGKDIPAAVTTLRELVAQGHKLILWTVRGETNKLSKKVNFLEPAVKWYKERSIELWGVNKNPGQKYWSGSLKAHADLFIDDMALGAPLKNGCIDWSVVSAYLFETGYLT